VREYITYNEPTPILLVKNLFEEEQIDWMMKEFEVLSHMSRFSPGHNQGDNHKKNLSCGTLDEFYKNRNVSRILTTMDEIYKDVKLVDTLKELSWFYDMWEWTNYDRTFITYSKKGDYYKGHTDIAAISLMYWIWNEPKPFEGGDIILNTKQKDSKDLTIPIERNMLMVMPSQTGHEVKPITKGYGRLGVIRFMYLLPAPNPDLKVDNIAIKN